MREAHRSIYYERLDAMAAYMTLTSPGLYLLCCVYNPFFINSKKKLRHGWHISSFRKVLHLLNRTRRQITKRQDDRRAHYLGRCVCCLSFNIFLPPLCIWNTRIMVVLLCIYVCIVYLSHLIIPGRSIWVAPRQVLRHFWLSSFDVNISRRLLYILILREHTHRERGATLGWISSTKQKKEEIKAKRKKKGPLGIWKSRSYPFFFSSV